jgi:YD repeat-containing protein
MARQGGFEPSTYGLEGRCSIRLSYSLLTKVDIPNGMHTLYAYDSQGRQTSIHHKDGSTVKQGFDYAFPPSADLRHNGGQITTITHEDGAYWAYEYDGRDRLTKAERYDDTPSLLHRFTYAYDDGDNMTTKAVYDPSGPSTVTTTFTYNDANEQTNMDDGTTSTDMAYDARGRLTSKDDGTYTATYGYGELRSALAVHGFTPFLAGLSACSDTRLDSRGRWSIPIGHRMHSVCTFQLGSKICTCG